METKKALLTIIIILAFALIATSLSQLTGYSVNAPTTLTVSPSSVSLRNTITITANSGQDIDENLKIYSLPGMTLADEEVSLECGGYKCNKGITKSISYVAAFDSGDYVVKAYDLKGNEVGSARFTVL